MNILILEREEVGARIPRSDRRWAHVKKVLRNGPGDRLAAGLAEGPMGEAAILELDDSGMVLEFEAFEGPAGTPPPLAPLRVVLGFPRPIQAARILKDLTSLGVAEIHLTGTELGERSYAQSSIFKGGDFRGPLLEGAEQAGNPRLPAVFRHWSLGRCLRFLDGDARFLEEEARPSEGDARPRERGTRVFLHPYGSPERLGLGRGLEAPVTLAVGSERGWTEAEMGALLAAGFSARGLGDRILKTETAIVAASALVLAGLGIL